MKASKPSNNLKDEELSQNNESTSNVDVETQNSNRDEESAYEDILDDDEHSTGSSYRSDLDSSATPAVKDGALNSYVFSKDFLPMRYDRHAQSDLPLRLMAFIELAINVVMIVIFIQGGVSAYTSTSFGIIELVITCFFFVLAMFWLNYKVHMVLMSVYRLYVDLDCCKKNNKYYSGLEVPDFFVQSKEYPHVTIQIPVYKENLQNTIKPTLLNCCREADRYMDETGTFCNIVVCDDGYNLIPENDRLERLEFYKEVGVAFTARPHPSKYPRKGRFKKAGNLNFSMNFSAAFGVTEDEDSELKTKRDELIALGACYGGDVSYGAYILLIDSDTRLPVIPMVENGCLKRLAKEMIFDGQEVLFIQCYTGPYMSVKSLSEKSVFHHTCNIYNSILIATAINSMAPLVGHNAFLNMKALTECAHVDEDTGYYNFWSEDRISEDFDLMMRGCEHGYNGRYACHAGIFLEGVSFSYMTEYFKISKFACGAAELIYNPMSNWCRDGIISSDLIGFVQSKEVEWYNKMIILAYILNFIALAAAHFGLIFNMFFCEYLYEILPLLLMPVNLMWEAIFVWTVVGGTLAYAFGIRLGFNKWLLVKQLLREAAFLTCLYGSISVRFSIMSFTHLFNWNLSFGATAKDDEKVTLVDWMKSTPMECTVYTFYTGLMVLRLLFLTAPGKLQFVLYFGCVPLMWSIFLFWTGPILFDVLPRKIDKTQQASYQRDDLMFIDKYFTQLPNSSAFTKIKVGSNVKLVPGYGGGPQSKGTADSELESDYSGSESLYSFRSPHTAADSHSQYYSSSKSFLSTVSGNNPEHHHHHPSNDSDKLKYTGVSGRDERTKISKRIGKFSRKVTAAFNDSSSHRSRSQSQPCRSTTNLKANKSGRSNHSNDSSSGGRLTSNKGLKSNKKNTNSSNESPRGVNDIDGYEHTEFKSIVITQDSHQHTSTLSSSPSSLQGSNGEHHPIII